MERTTDVDTLEVKYAFSAWQLVLGAVLAVVLGFLGAVGGKMYTRHNDQHGATEQALRQQEQINREFAQAINQLIQRAGGAPPAR